MTVVNIGKRVRELRKQSKMTLVELAEKTGVAQATLSRIETGVMPGTIESHQQLADALNLTLAELYGGLDARKEKTALKQKTALAAEVRPTQKIQVEVLTQEVQKKKMSPLLITLAGRTRMKAEQCERGVEKFLYVVDGAIDVSVDKDKYALKRADALYFDASLKHTISNPTQKKAKLFSIASPPKI